MKTIAFHILRIGLAITFLWIGVLIFKEPIVWGGFLPSWIAQSIPFSIKQIMFGVGAFDFVVGGLLLINLMSRIVAPLAAIHLAAILAISGINNITVRDIGLLAGAIAISLYAWSPRF